MSGAPLNNPAAPPAVQFPRLLVYCGTDVMVGCFSARVESNNWYAADRFDASFSLLADQTHTAAWWDTAAAAQPGLQLDIRFSLDGASYTSLIVGLVDSIDIDLEQAVVHVTGRDLASVLMEAKTAETFQNQTASQVAQTLAARHGMTANVDATTALVGKYYQIDHDHLTAGQFSRTTTEWDLLTYLAQQEGYDLYVSGTALNFKQPANTSQPAFVVQWNANNSYPISNVVRLRLERAATLAKDIEVWVRSWSAKTGSGFTVKARAIGAKSATPQVAANQIGTTTQRYVYVIPGLTLAQAQAKANALLADLSKHERRVSFDVPNDLALTPRNLIAVQGTGTGFDQTFFVDTISRDISFGGGFSMHVAAKNHDSRSQTIPA